MLLLFLRRNSLPFPDLDFVKCYEVEIVHQISKESTLYPAGYGAVYCCK